MLKPSLRASSYDEKKINFVLKMYKIWHITFLWQFYQEKLGSELKMFVIKKIPILLLMNYKIKTKKYHYHKVFIAV